MIALALVVLLFAVLGGVLLWLSSWDGSGSYDELAAGSRVIMVDGVSLTVPSGWEAFDTVYRDVPSWVPFGANRQAEMHEIVNLRSTQESSGLVSVLVYFRDTTPAALAGADVVGTVYGSTVYAMSDETGITAIEVIGTDVRAWVMFQTEDEDSLGSAQYVWDLLEIDGVSQ